MVNKGKGMKKVGKSKGKNYKGFQIPKPKPKRKPNPRLNPKQNHRRRVYVFSAMNQVIGKEIAN